MAAVVVTFDGTRLANAEAQVDVAAGEGGTWEDIDTTKAAGTNADIVYQGSGSISEKLTNTKIAGIEFEATNAKDFSTTPKVVLLKIIMTTPGSLPTTLGTNSLNARIGSDQSNYYLYHLHTNASYPASESWLQVLIDPNVSGYRDGTTGSPSLTVVDYYACHAQPTASPRDDNLAMDAIDFFDVGTGLTLVGGDGVSADGTFEDLRAFDEGTTGNRYGLCTSKEGIFYVLGTLTIGTATVTEFNDTNQVVVFPDGKFNVGCAGLAFGLQNASTAIDINDTVLKGAGSEGGTADTRPDYTTTGTSGLLTITGCTFDVFRNWTMTSGALLSFCNLLGGELLTMAGGELDSCSFTGGTQATGEHYVLTTSPSLIGSCAFTSGGAGHAVRCDTVGTYNWTGNTDSGYTGTRGTNLVSSSGSTDAMFYNNSGGLITLNVGGGGQAPSVRNGAGATTQVNANVTVTFDNMKDNTEVRIYTAGTDTELAGIENATAGTTDNRNFAAAITAGASVDYTLVSVLYEIIRVESFTWPSADQTINVQQRFDRNNLNPP